MIVLQREAISHGLSPEACTKLLKQARSDRSSSVGDLVMTYINNVPNDVWKLVCL